MYPIELVKSLWKIERISLLVKKKDIHESDIEYLENSYNNSLYIADKYNWKKIKCVEDEKLRSIEVYMMKFIT